MKTESIFSIAVPRPNAAFRLFCFPHAGGSPVVFFDWAQQLGPEIECVCVQYPGKAQRFREAPLTSVNELVREVEEGLALQRESTFALYGHSLGGVVAFELARQLRRRGRREPAHLFVGATRPPHLESPYSPIHQLSEQAFIERVQARYGGIPATIYRDPEILQMFLPGLRADFRAYETYVFENERPLGFPITAFGGADDTVVSPDSLKEWALHTVAGFDMNVLPGSHFFSATSVTELARVLQARLTGAQNWVGSDGNRSR